MNHREYCIASVLIEQLDCEKTYNGAVDHTQEIVWRFNGQEVMRSCGGQRTYTPLFADLAISKINELFR